MVVLLRAFTHLDAYEDSLERAGLRPYVVGGRGYWSQQQVADVCALLATIANPLDDQALLGALASPRLRRRPDTLWLLRRRAAASARSGRRSSGPSALGEAELEDRAPGRADPRGGAGAAARLRDAGSARCASAGTRLPLAALIERAVTETGYDLAC